MASSSLDPTTGAPRFLDQDAPDPAVNPTEVAAFAGKVGTRPIGTTAERLAYPFAREGLKWFDTTVKGEFTYQNGAWRQGQITHFTWSRVNVDSLAQFPQLSLDAGPSTNTTQVTFKRVSGSDPDGEAGVQFAQPGLYTIQVSVVLGTAAGGRSFVQVGSDTSPYFARSSFGTAEDRCTVTSTVFVDAAAQVVPIKFYKSNGSVAAANTGRVIVSRIA